MNTVFLKRVICTLFICFLAGSSMVGCRRTGKGPLMPEGWMVEDASGSDISVEESDGGQEGGDAESVATTANQDGTQVQAASEASVDNYYPEVSNSASFYDNIPLIHESVKNAEIGREMEIWAIEDEKLTETDFVRILRQDTYTYGAVLDYINRMDLGVSETGVNIFVTDLFSNYTTSSELGKWIAKYGSGCSLYVMPMKYDGEIYFKEYRDYENALEVCIRNYDGRRDLLVAVFGDDAKVLDFDRRFQDELHEALGKRNGYYQDEEDKELETFDYIHFSRGDVENTGDEGLIQLKAAPCFRKRLRDVRYYETNISWGVTEQEISEETVWNNTFAFEKLRYELKDAPDKTSIVLYGDTDVPMKAIGTPDISVLEYDRKDKAWKKSGQTFTLNAETVLDDMPASQNEDINERLGGDMISPGEGGALLLSLETNGLGAGKYAVEVRQKIRNLTTSELQELASSKSNEKVSQPLDESLSMEIEPVYSEGAEDGTEAQPSRAGNVKDDSQDLIKGLVRDHSADYTEYFWVLDNYCKKTSTNNAIAYYQYNGNGTDALSKLLDLKGLVGEFSSQGWRMNEQEVCFRVLLDM